MSYLSGVRTDWVWTRLQNGDMLSTLAPLYGLQAKEIVLGNGVSWNSAAIEGDAGWVRQRGSRTKLGARWVFDSNTTILLPRGGPRSEVGAGTPTPTPTPTPSLPVGPPLTDTLPKGDVKEAGIPPIALAIGAAGLAFLVLGGMKKKKRKKSKSVKAAA